MGAGTRLRPIVSKSRDMSKDQKSVSKAKKTGLGAVKSGLTACFYGLLLILVLQTPLVESGQADPEIKVTNARVGVHPDKTRFVIDLSTEVKFRVFTLASPYRVVLDLPQVEWQLPFKSGTQGAGPVDGVRYDLFKAGTSRIVLDLNKPLSVDAAFLIPAKQGDGQRLVVDLTPTTKDLFQKTAGWPVERPQTAKTRSTKIVPIPRPKRPKHIVVLDPGHGGKDPGATGVTGKQEAPLVLDIAKELKVQLEGTGHYQVFLTRSDDSSLKLRDRVQFARDKKADLFLSIHADSIDRKDIRGASIYTLSETASDKEAEELAKKENEADILLGVDMGTNSDEVNDILIDLAMRDTMNSSVRAAKKLAGEVKKTTKVVKNVHRSASLVVLKAPDVPSVLIELGYLSNKEDEKNLDDDDWQARMAKSIVKGVESYFRTAEIMKASR